jgi:hypothetical protein
MTDTSLSFDIPTKVQWRVNLSLPANERFYKSRNKEIVHDNEHFSSNFSITTESVTEQILTTVCIPFYDTHIAHRDDYVLDKEDQHKKQIERLRLGRQYQIMTIHVKKTKELAGMALFAVEDSKAYSTWRVFDPEIRKAYKRRTTIDYWAEMKLHEYLQENHINWFSHGHDSYPNYNRLGLPLFKLSVGCSPYVSLRDYPVRSTTFEALSKEDNQPIFFFTNPDSENRYTQAHSISHPDNINEHVFNGLKKVLAWKDIELIEHVVHSSSS